MGKRHTMETLGELMEKKNLSVKQVADLLEAKAQQARPKVRLPRTKSVYKFGIVSDTHLCAKTCALEELHSFYKRCKGEGVTDIVHGGDLYDGQGVYPGHLNELLVYGADQHLAYAVENYPRVAGITTYTIGGNHCESYIKHFGIDLVAALAAKRKDIVYLGMYNATLVLNGVRIMLQHMSGGSSYAISYKPQRYVSNLPAGSKPNIWVGGHLHTSSFFVYRSVNTFLPGCFQHANFFTMRLGLNVTVGGWIVEVEVADDKRSSIKSIKPNFIAYYAKPEPTIR